MIGETFSIGNQEWRITNFKEIDESMAFLRKAMIENDKEPRHYFAAKVLKSGKQSKQSGMFYRFNSGRFIKVL